MKFYRYQTKTFISPASLSSNVFSDFPLAWELQRRNQTSFASARFSWVPVFIMIIDILENQASNRQLSKLNHRPTFSISFGTLRTSQSSKFKLIFIWTQVLQIFVVRISVIVSNNASLGHTPETSFSFFSFSSSSDGWWARRLHQGTLLIAHT